MNNDIKVGLKVLIDLGNESFIGVVHEVDKKRTRIRLKNVEDFKTKIKYSGIQNYFFSNIKTIIYLEDQTENINNESSENFRQPDSNVLYSDDIKEDLILKKIPSNHEWLTIDNTLNNIKLINQNDASYFSAINDLNNEKYFVMIMEDCDFGRNEISSVITIYAPTNKIVYIFDIVHLQKIHRELRLLFENQNHKKIMFNSQMTCDHLKYAQNIDNLNGIFDVFVAFLIIFTDEKSINLIPCIKKFFNLPENYFNSDVSYNWRSRPLSENHQIFTAKKAIFLYKLYEYILHEHLLIKFYETCQSFSKTLSDNNDSVEVANLLSNNDKTAEKSIQDRDVELSFSLN